MPNGNPNSIIEAVRQFFTLSPVLKDYGVNVDFLPNTPAYSIDVVPGDPVYKRYVDGGVIYQLNFTFTANMEADGDPRTMTANQDFFQELLDWVASCDKSCAFPYLPDHKVIRLQITSSGYLFNDGGDLAAYQAGFRLLYL